MLLGASVLLWSPSTSSAQEKMVTQKIINLAHAIAEHEGWAPDKHLAAKEGGPTVSYRNHNPGNLRSSTFALGVRDGFAFFYNDATGMFALYYDLMCKCQGKTRTTLNPDSILADLIKVYSASEGEALDRYIQFVCSRTGLTAETRIGGLVE